MADQIINTIKPILVGELTKEINEHKNNFDQVEKSIDKVIDGIEGKIKPIAEPVVAGIKLIPFGDPKEKLSELADEIKLKIEGIDLSELSNIEGLPEDIKSRVASLPDKVKTKLKDSIDKIITGEEKSDASNNTEAVKTDADESKTESEVNESKTESASASSTPSSNTKADESPNKDLDKEYSDKEYSDIKNTFSKLATDQQDETRKNIIEQLLMNGVFNNHEHILEFIKIISKVASPSSSAQAIGSVMPPPPTSAVQAIGTEDAKTEEAKTEEAKTEEANTEEANTEGTKTEEANTEEANTEEAKTKDANTKGGAPKKQRRKTKKNIRRGKLNKSTRFGRAF